MDRAVDFASLKASIVVAERFRRRHGAVVAEHASATARCCKAPAEPQAGGLGQVWARRKAEAGRPPRGRRQAWPGPSGPPLAGADPGR